MADSQDMAKAKRVYESIIRTLDGMNWKYDKIEDEFIIKSGVKGDDLPIGFFLVVKPKNEVVQFISALSFEMPEDKRIEGAVAVCAANYGLVDGSFDYNLKDGKIIFRLTSSYRDSELSEEVFRYMVLVASGTVDHYNDKFFMLAKGVTSIQDFLNDVG